METSPVEEAKIFESLKAVESFAVKLPVKNYPMTQLVPLNEYLNAILNGLKAPMISFELVSPAGVEFMDYKNMVETRMVSVPMCSIQVLVGLLIVVHRFAGSNPTWTKKLPGVQPEPTDGAIKLDVVWSEFKSHMTKMPIRVVNVEKINLGETALDTYLQAWYESTRPLLIYRLTRYFLYACLLSGFLAIFSYIGVAFFFLLLPPTILLGIIAYFVRYKRWTTKTNGKSMWEE